MKKETIQQQNGSVGTATCNMDWFYDGVQCTLYTIHMAMRFPMTIIYDIIFNNFTIIADGGDAVAEKQSKICIRCRNHYEALRIDRSTVV